MGYSRTGWPTCIKNNDLTQIYPFSVPFKDSSGCPYSHHLHARIEIDTFEMGHQTGGVKVSHFRYAELVRRLLC